MKEHTSTFCGGLVRFEATLDNPPFSMVDCGVYGTMPEPSIIVKSDNTVHCHLKNLIIANKDRYVVIKKEEYLKIVDFADKQKDLDPEIKEIISRRFWEMI